MAHELTMTNGTAEMAWAVTPPWHNLGQRVDPGASVEEWQAAAGLQWNIHRAPVQFTNGDLRSYSDKHVLFRDDTNEPLSVVSSKYNVVQPHEVLEFFRDLVGAGGFTINTAGSLRGGRRIWALAEIGKTAKVVGDDAVGGYLLLATSCDGGLATTARFTTVRVVCANTLAIAENGQGKKISVPHNTKFDPASMKTALGIAANNFEFFMQRARNLAGKPVGAETAENFVAKLLANPNPHAPADYDVRKTRGFNAVLDLFNGQAKGAWLDGARGTAWGLVNAVTEYIDHFGGARTDDARLHSAWFGRGDSIKSAAFDLAMTI